jgi:hypothetical protein
MFAHVCRSWWVVLRDALLLREGVNMLSVVLQPAVAVALRSKALNAYRIPTMAVSDKVVWPP